MCTRRRDGRSFPGAVAPGALLLILSAFPSPGAAMLQERAVVSSEVVVSPAEATLRLEFLDGGRLEVVFREGEVVLDGDPVGRFSRGDRLDQAWRSLLGQAVALENGPLARALLDWSPPPGLTGEAEEVAARLDSALEDRLQPGVDTARSLPGEDTGVVEELLARPELLPSLGRALEGFDRTGARIQVGGGPVDIAPGETVSGSLVVVDSDVEVRGVLDGDLVLVRGSLRVREDGEIRGDVRLVDARLFRDGGRILGEVTNLAEEASSAVDVDRLRNQIRDEIRRELRADAGRSTRRVPSPMRNLSRGISGLFENLVTVLVLSGLGWVAVHFAGDRVTMVSEAIRANPARSGLVGLAGAFLLLPVWVLGSLALVVSLVGILALPFWLLLFPVVAALASFLGALASASLLGEWLSRRHIQGLERLRPSNLFHTVPAGIAVLFAAFMVANVLRIAGPLTAVFRGLLVAAGVVALVVAAVVGLGGVLLTRGGARAAGEGAPWDGGLDTGPWSSFRGPGSAGGWQARWDAERARWRRPQTDAGDESEWEDPLSDTPGNRPDDPPV